jgi:hypothetical protein
MGYCWRYAVLSFGCHIKRRRKTGVVIRLLCKKEEEGLATSLP